MSPVQMLLVTAMVAMTAADFYDAKYDDFDIHPLLENDRIMIGYTKCFLEQGPCTPEAKDFRKTIPEALETSCAKCTPKQKELIRTVIRAVMEQHPEVWEELVQKYDKDKKYRESFDRFIKGED